MAAPAVNLPASISPHQSRAGQPGGVSSPWRRWRHRRPISQHQYRHAKAAPGNRAVLPRPGVDGGTSGQSPSINIATPKPRRKAGRQSRPTSMAAPAVNLPVPISPHQSRAGRLAAIHARRRWRHRRPIPITPKPRRKTGRQFRPTSMATPATNPDHAKAAPEG